MVLPIKSVKEIPIAKSYLDRNESRLVDEVIGSGWISQGSMVERFEKVFAGYTGAKYAVAVSSGTAALHLALLAEGIGGGDEVIAPSFSFIATTNSILYTSARPVFVDIDPKTYNIDPDLVEAFLKNDCRYDQRKKILINRNTGSRVKAIMPVHQFGLPCNLDRIVRIAKKYRLKIIEDAACALGSSYKGKRVGSGSTLACFSFHPRKIITTGEGGMVVTDSYAAAEKMRSLRNHGLSSRYEDYDVLGYNYRMTDIQAAIGLCQMKKLPDMLKKRAYLAQRYDMAFKCCRSIAVPHIPNYARPNYQSYVIRLKNANVVTRDVIVRKLMSSGISTRRGNTAIHMQALYKKYGAILPETKNAALSTIALPIYFGMTDREQDFVIENILSSIGSNKNTQDGFLMRTKLRNANRSDCHDLFIWRNDPEMRKNSISGSREVGLEEHKKWFYSKLKNPNSRLYIASSGRDKIGLMRFEIEGDHVEVGTNVNPAFRGMGVGTMIMGLGTQRMFEEIGKPIIARIKNDNIASIKMCCNNGYKIQKRTKEYSLLRFNGI